MGRVLGRGLQGEHFDDHQQGAVRSHRGQPRRHARGGLRVPRTGADPEKCRERRRQSSQTKRLVPRRPGALRRLSDEAEEHGEGGVSGALAGSREAVGQTTRQVIVVRLEEGGNEPEQEPPTLGVLRRAPLVEEGPEHQSEVGMFGALHFEPGPQGLQRFVLR